VKNHKKHVLAYARKYRKKNWEKTIKRQREWFRNHPSYKKDENGKTIQKYLDTSTSCQMLKNYGITLKEYDEMFAKQNGLCFICGNPEKVICKSGKLKRLAIDHNHRTGKIRKLLCDDCNVGLGKFRDNIIVMERAIQYLKDHGI
jgi:hypothetical protein